MRQIILPRGKHCQMYTKARGAWKIFDAYPYKKFKDMDIEKAKWGDYKLKETTIIQNYAWWHGLAPRVYDIVKVRVDRSPCHYYFAQDVQEQTGKEEKDQVYEKVTELGKTYGFKIEKEDCSNQDVIGGKLVDFNTFHFTEDHQDKIKELYREQGRYGKIYYHKIPEWGLKKGPRDNDYRVKAMKLDKIDFKGKSVVDIGCAGGWFTRYVKDKGAKYVKGVDTKETVHAAFIAANELGYWDVDYQEADLRKGHDEQFDIAFFLSMNHHVPVPKTIQNAKMLVYEDNDKDKEKRHSKEVDPQFKKWFKKIEFIGFAQDHDKIGKSIYHMYK